MLAASVLSIFALAVVAPLLVRVAGRSAALIAAAVPGAWFLWFASQLPAIAGGTPLTPEAMPWVEAVGITIAWRLDGLGLLFALLVTGIGSAICVYAGGYMGGHERFGKFLATLLAFMASMLGLVIADDLILLFVFWELTSISSFLLIGFGREREAARQAAMRALVITGAGGLALLAGVILLGLEAGTFRVSEVLERRDLVVNSPLYVPILALVCLGCFTKSAQVPFHFWLPGAMEAPAPVSAYLHSSTMVKAGIFLLARLMPAMGDTPEWTGTLVVVGSITMVYAALLAARSRPLKRILAYTTVSALGTMTVLLGLGVPGEAAAMGFLLAHALYKGTLFMVAGVIEKQSGEKDVEKLGGLRHRMPVTFAAAVLGALSLAGVPPLFGYTAKSLMKSSTGASEWATALLVAVTVTGAGMAAAGLLVAMRPFFGPGGEPATRAKEASPALLFGPVVLAILGVVAGLAPGLFANDIVQSATAAVTGAAGDDALKGAITGFATLFSVKGLPTVLALVLGVLLYVFRDGYRTATGVMDHLGPLEGPALFDRGLAGVLGFGRLQTGVLQHGSLNGYVRTCILGLIAVGGTLLIPRLEGVNLVPPGKALVQPIEGVLVALMVSAALAATLFNRRLASVASLGVVGVAAALLFVLFGAPDVAMTQFAIETLTVLIFVLVFYHLPQFRRYTSTGRRVFDWGVSLVFGAFMTLLMLLAIDTRFARPVSDFFSENAYTQANGRNIVNVIIVDFRAVDTFGELFVLALAGMGVATLLIIRKRATDDGTPGLTADPAGAGDDARESGP